MSFVTAVGLAGRGVESVLAEEAGSVFVRDGDEAREEHRGRVHTA